MRAIWIAFGAVVLGAASTLATDGPASRPATASAPAPRPQVEATIDPKKDGIVTISVKNVSDKPVMLRDIPEGTGTCDQYWQVEVTVNGKVLRQDMLYAPAGDAFDATIKSGETYTRDLQPSAYLWPEERYAQGTACVLVIHHKVLAKEETNKRIEFSTAPLKTTTGAIGVRPKGPGLE